MPRKPRAQSPVPTMNEPLASMMRGLTLHYLHQRTVEDAIEQGRAGGVPEALLQCLPAMMFEITSAAGAVFGGGQDLDKVVNEVTRRARASGRAEGFGRSDAMALVKSAIQFLTELSEQRGIDQPLPEMTEPWYRYGTD